MRSLVTLTLAAFILGACSDDGGPGGQPADQVWMQGSTFTPANRTIASGSAVTWVNQDATAHNIISNTVPAGASAFSSGPLLQAGTFQQTLTVAGAYTYFCSIHGSATTGMRGTITVN